jgi:hypothetical protein
VLPILSQGNNGLVFAMPRAKLTKSVIDALATPEKALSTGIVAVQVSASRSPQRDGRSVNGVARTADMTKVLKRPAVVSDEVARRAAFTLADLGSHELRGIATARRLWAMEVE